MTIQRSPQSHGPEHIIGLDSAHLNGGTAPWHRHVHAQLLYPAEGVVRVWADANVWMVHSSSALWIPPRTPHKFVASGHVLPKTVLVSELQSNSIGSACFMTGISPLLRALLIAINEIHRHLSPSPRFSALETQILDEIQSGGRISMSLPWPKDARLQTLCEQLLNGQPGRPSLNDVADKLSVSSRTLMRLFVKETGLTFSNWIQQMQVSSAVLLLEEGISVGQIAHRLGFASAESFGNMFKRQTGCSTGKFISSSHYTAAR